VVAKKKPLFVNREISWLNFNERVLQEAEDEKTPLIERFRFLGIFSNNQDEFFRVRVASVKRLLHLKKVAIKKLDTNPAEVLLQINKIVKKQQNRFGKIYDQLLLDAQKKGVHIIDETECSDSQKEEVSKYFREVVHTNLVSIMLDSQRELPNLKDSAIYLAIKLSNSKNDTKPLYALIEVPAKNLSRFMVMKGSSSNHYIMLLDDVIRANLKEVFSIFDYKHIEAYTIKLTRDAELDFDDDMNMTMLESLSKSISGRKKANPVRFLYDKKIPADLQSFLFKKLNVRNGDNAIAGGKYHNFKDFINFPTLNANTNRYKEHTPLPHPDIIRGNVLKSIKKQDVLLNYPYQSFEVIINMLREAAIDPKVKKIKINLYRVAKNSKIINSLISATKNGKSVTVIIELYARFDEENNIYWANKLKEEGVEVIFGVPNLKVHSKLILITRKEKSQTRNYVHVGSGNFNENTATLYTDISLLTTDSRIAGEVAKVFEFLENNFKVKRYSHIILSPTGTRRKLIELINQEIKNAKKGIEAGIILKLNNLSDEKMILKLYEASQTGVKIQLIIRGICSLVPGVVGLSENITAVSIVDQFLEHTRVLLFKNSGDEKIFISSADWMKRNLDKRIEVTVPIYEVKLKKTIKDILDIQLSDNVKSHDFSKNNTNMDPTTKPYIRSQIDTYKYFLAQH
jgi:polyphosphate kinase